MHTVKEADMLATKMDLLMKRLDNCAPQERSYEGHHLGHRLTNNMRGRWQRRTFGNDYPETREDAAFISNGF
jgi:hypothetical protein